MRLTARVVEVRRDRRDPRTLHVRYAYDNADGEWLWDGWVEVDYGCEPWGLIAAAGREHGLRTAGDLLPYYPLVGMSRELNLG